MKAFFCTQCACRIAKPGLCTKCGGDAPAKIEAVPTPKKTQPKASKPGK